MHRLLQSCTVAFYQMPSADMQKILATIRTIRQAAKLKGEKALTLTMSSMPTLTQSEKVTEGAHLQFSICGFLLMWPKSTLIAKEAFLYLSSSWGS